MAKLDIFSFCVLLFLISINTDLKERQKQKCAVLVCNCQPLKLVDSWLLRNLGLNGMEEGDCRRKG